MLIQKTRIRSLEANLPGVAQGTILVFAFAPTDSEEHRTRLARAGFPPPFEPGRAVLPAVVKSVSRFNAEGKFLVHRDRPKETAHKRLEWHWVERHGDDRVEQTDFKDIPYKRYPRTFIPPPGVELKQAVNTAEERLIVSDPAVYDDANAGAILHAINLFLELFGECTVLDRDLASIINVPVTRLNWRVLPPGARPWSEMEGLIKGVMGDIDGDKGKVFRNNLAIINQYRPEFAAAGIAGFNGYVIFGFPGRNLYVCESIYNYNATYVFEEDWETLSRMTKAEILVGNLQKERLIHQPGWHDRVRRLLG